MLHAGSVRFQYLYTIGSCRRCTEWAETLQMTLIDRKCHWGSNQEEVTEAQR